MDYKDKQESISRFENIFKNEKTYYGKKKPNFSGYFDSEADSFFKRAYVKFNHLLGNVEGKKVLDVGCGTGNLSFFLAHKGANVTGIDLSKNFIEFCKETAMKLKLSIDFKEMNAQLPEFPEESFDIIVGSRIIHHLPDIKLFLGECKRLLKNGGYVVFIEPLKKNPIVQLNRKFYAPKARTRHEHPLFISDVMIAREILGNIQHYEYFLLSPLAMFFNRIVKKASLFKFSYKFLNVVETPLYKIKYLAQFCWQTVFKSIKQ
ncbi:MAG: class I SAM-dependent methyltransferase [Promethearchaeota archaeon]|jgi:2-polyprenyl-3-methyl-5-hydroxy-6-metoxy-1,4-benzoquinol methylase